ncbi:hypothetical protein DPX16_17382 [Anabarilius grahami]|uniref:Uncharacterized protein n=1 Tax=Anabarilius grahami TaxID=495550 RepID=A0A3N0XYT7_ANAGA|nr:hypothetical protein DPX16_17382 [Anabarilius grahami]
MKSLNIRTEGIPARRKDTVSSADGECGAAELTGITRSLGLQLFVDVKRKQAAPPRNRRTDLNRWKSPQRRMGLFLVSELSELPVSPKPTTASDRLCGFRQDGRSLERYVKEFVELAYLANWPDAYLNACFLAGLDEDMIRFKEPACYFSLVEAINLILFLNCSDFVIEEVLDQLCNPRLVPTETQAAWPVRQSPLSSAYPSSGHSPGVLPDPNPRMAEENSSAGPRQPKRRKKKAVQPQSPELSASMQPQSPDFSAPVQPQSPELSASVQPQSPELSASVQPQSPELSASVQSQSPEFSAAKQPKTPVTEKEDWLIDFWAEPAPSLFDLAPVPNEPAPVQVELIIEYEGMSWTPSPDPSPASNKPAPCFHEPAPGFNEPAPSFNEPVPSFNESAPGFNEPAPCLAEPAPCTAEPTQVVHGTTPCHEPFQAPLSLPKNFFWGGPAMAAHGS